MDSRIACGGREGDLAVGEAKRPGHLRGDEVADGARQDAPQRAERCPGGASLWSAFIRAARANLSHLLRAPRRSPGPGGLGRLRMPVDTAVVDVVSADHYPDDSGCRHTLEKHVDVPRRVLVVSLASLAIAGQPSSALDALTAPAATLPAGCALATAPSERIGNGRVVSGFWFGLPSGRICGLATLRRSWPTFARGCSGCRRCRIPPWSARRADCGADRPLTLVEGMSGYAAFYRQDGARVAVDALRAADPRQWTRSSLAEHDDGTGQAFTRFRNGQVAVLVVGDCGPCFTALEQHLRAWVSTGDAPHAKAPASLLLDRAYMHDVRTRGERADPAIEAAIRDVPGGCQEGARNRADVRDGQVGHASQRRAGTTT